MSKSGKNVPPGKAIRRVNPKVLYSLPLLFPISLWILAAITLYYYGPKLVKYQEEIAAIVLPILIGLFTIITIHFLLVMRRKLKGNTKIKPQTRFAQVSFTALCILFNIIFVYLITPHLAAIHFSSGPILTWGTDQDPTTGVSIVWKTADPTSTSIFLGTNPAGLMEYTVPGTMSEWHKISVDGLAPGIRYYYRVPGFRDDELFSFTTASPAPANFSFLFFADARQNDGEFVVPILPNLPQYMDNFIRDNSLNVAFTVVGGDFVGEGDNIATWKTWFDDISVTSGLATARPMAIVPGNHERHNDYPGAMFSKVFPLDDRPNFYYSFNYSQLHVTVLDPWNATNGWWGDFDQAQVDWLQSDLANASGMAFKVICMHPPPIRRDGTAHGNMAFLTQLCDTHDVDAVLFGHDHEYAVNQVNGTLYLLAGVGGNLAHFVSGTGFAQVDVRVDEMRIKMHWINGTSVDLCMIPA
jgi:hypothetical protein